MIEYGSEATLLIKAKNEVKIGDRVYAPNQVYALFKDVGIEFLYDTINSDIAAKRTVFTGNIDSFPSRLNIYNLPFIQKVIDLAFVKQNNNKTLTSIETVNAINGKSYLNHKVAANLIVIKDKVILPQTNYSYSGDELIIEDGTYIVSYDYLAEGSIYNLDAPFYPYFAAEVTVVGNTNKQTNKIHLVFPTIKISQVPKLQFTNEGVCSTPLVCDIIYKGQDTPYMVVE